MQDHLFSQSISVSAEHQKLIQSLEEAAGSLVAPGFGFLKALMDIRTHDSKPDNAWHQHWYNIDGQDTESPDTLNAPSMTDAWQTEAPP